MRLRGHRESRLYARGRECGGRPGQSGPLEISLFQVMDRRSPRPRRARGPLVPMRRPHFSVISGDVGLGPLAKPAGVLSSDGPLILSGRASSFKNVSGGDSFLPLRWDHRVSPGGSHCVTAPQGAHGSALEHEVKTSPSFLVVQPPSFCSSLRATLQARWAG